MSTALPRKRLRNTSKVLKAKRLNRRMPEEVEQYRLNIKMAILSKLYDRQLRHWNNELRILSHENALSQGRGNDEIMYAIYWNNRRYTPQLLDWTDNPEKAYCLQLNPRIKEYADRMEVIAEEFDELREERYEAERFLSNLFLFSAPPKRLEKILGQSLYRVAKNEIERFCSGFSDRDWEMNNEFSLRTFVESNQEIIELMNQRVMTNLVTV